MRNVCILCGRLSTLLVDIQHIFKIEVCGWLKGEKEGGGKGRGGSAEANVRNRWFAG